MVSVTPGENVSSPADWDILVTNTPSDNVTDNLANVVYHNRLVNGSVRASGNLVAF